MSVPGCCLASLGGCELPLHELAETVLVKICDRAGRTWEPMRDTSSRQSGACKTHYDMFVRAWGIGRMDRPIAKKPHCDVCLNRGRFKKKKRKSLDWTVTWNRGHPQSPLQAGPLVCDPCTKRAKANPPGTKNPTASSNSVAKANPPGTKNPTASSNSVANAWIDTKFVHGNDTGDWCDERDDGEDSGGCEHAFFDGGCEPDTVTTRCCLIQCCDVCAAHTNWTCMRCYTPFDELQYDPDHWNAADHRHKRDRLGKQSTPDALDDEDRMEVDEVASATNEDEEYLHLRLIQPVRSSAHPRFFIIWENDDEVCFDDLHGRNHTVPREVFQERCELLLAIDSQMDDHADGGHQRSTPSAQANSGQQQTNSDLEVVKLGEANAVLMEENAELKNEYAELKEDYAALQDTCNGLREAYDKLQETSSAERYQLYQLKVKLQETERAWKRRGVLLAEARARQKTLNLSAKRREARIRKVELELKQTKELLRQSDSDEGKLAVVMEFVKRQIFGTPIHILPQARHSSHADTVLNSVVFTVKKGKRSYKWSFKKRIVEASKNSKSMRCMRGPITSSPFAARLSHFQALPCHPPFARLIGPILQKWFVRCSSHSLARNLTSRS
jgi:hypothetical protein